MFRGRSGRVVSRMFRGHIVRGMLLPLDIRVLVCGSRHIAPSRLRFRRVRLGLTGLYGRPVMQLHMVCLVLSRTRDIGIGHALGFRFFVSV